MHFESMGRRYVTIAPASWTPASLTGLFAWYKGDAGVTGSSPVTAWADQSGNGYNLSGSNNPTTTTLNGLTAISFPQTTEDSLSTGTSSVSLGGTTLSCFAVGTFTDALYTIGAACYGGFIATGDTVTYATTASSGIDNANSAVFGIHRNGGFESFGVGGTASVWIEFGAVFDGTNGTFYINNVAQTVYSGDTSSFGATGQIILGNNEVGGASSPTKIAEIFFTNHAVSSGDRTNIQTYFTNKWGV